MSVIFPSNEESSWLLSGKSTLPPSTAHSSDFTSYTSEDTPLTSDASASDTLASFCPNIISYLITNDLVSISSRTFTFPGYCMLADISGFTKLSSDLCDRGPAGLDELRQCTSAIFGTIVELVTSHGGDVLFFAGDALICIFQDTYVPYHHVVPAAQRVLACATCIQQIRTSLRIHTGISYGSINLSILGGVSEKWSYVINGECMAELAQCLDDAGPRETVITASVADTLNGNTYDTKKSIMRTKSGIKVHQLPSGNSILLDVPIVPQSALLGGSDDVRMVAVATPFIPSPVLNAVYSGTVAELAELRNITTLFMKLNSYSSTEHKDLTSLQPFYHAMQEIIFECGGYIRQFIIDDKGCVLIVLWGVPTASFPNNCSRAVRCAAAMSAKTASLNHECSIGITTGTAYCGTVGSSRRQDYVAIGKTVNLAARLMIRANGGILSDETTQECLPTSISSSFVLLQPVKLKGFDKLISCYTYSSTIIPECYVSVDRRQASTFLVTSRETTVMLSKIIESARNLRRDNSTDAENHLFASENKSVAEYYIISGPVGYGKSTIASNIGILLEDESFRVLRLILTKQHETVPFAALRQLFLLLIGSDNFDSTHKQKEVVWDLLQRCYPNEDVLDLSAARFPILQCILQLSWGGHITSKRLPNYYDINECDNSTMMDVLAYLLKKNHITAIIIDNAHHMCSGTWNQFAYFALNHIPIITVLTTLDQNTVEGDTPVSSAYVAATDMLVKSTLRHPRHGPHSVTNKDTSYSKGHALLNNQMFVIGYLCDVANTHVVNLTGLNEHGVQRVIEASIAPAGVPREIVRKVYKLTRGNPFWVSELAKVIAECGIEAFANLVSKGIEQNLLATCILSRYTTAQCSVVKMASVLGREFHADVLAAIVAPDIHAVLSRILFELVEAGIIRYVESDVYRFQSSLLSDMIYGLLPPSTASALHFEVAKTIEVNYMNNLADHVAALAYHYSMSPRESRHHAFAYAVSAAEHLSTQFAFNDTLNYLQLALEVSSTSSDIRHLRCIVDRNIQVVEFLRSSNARQKASGLLNMYIHFMKLRDALEHRKRSSIEHRDSPILRVIKRLVCGGRVDVAEKYTSEYAVENG